MKKNISISVLDALDINDFLIEIKKVQDTLDALPKKLTVDFFELSVHFDVMDQKFVANEGIAMEYMRIAKQYGMYIDTHLMVKSPIVDGYIDRAIELGTDAITIHYEIDCVESVLRYLQKRKQEIKEKTGKELRIGISVKPETNVQVLEAYQDQFSHILIMSVEPGRGGQGYIPLANEKIKHAKQLYPKHTIQVDGGVQLDTMIAPLQAGVDSLVMGSFLSKRENHLLYEAVLQCNIQKEIAFFKREVNTDFDAKIFQIVPGGYGEGDQLIGIRSPQIRELMNRYYRYLPLHALSYYMTSPYHEYRKFACFVLSELGKKEIELTKQYELVCFMEQYLSYINNWDLTDAVGPHVLGNYLLKIERKEAKKKLQAYLSDAPLFVRRIGIVSLLVFAMQKEIFFVCDIVEPLLYEREPLLQKAIGWVLREAYKKDPVAIVEYLMRHQKEKKLPSFLITYACEKMSQKEKARIRE